MAAFTTLRAAHVVFHPVGETGFLPLAIGVQMPNLQASVVNMACHIALLAHINILGVAHRGHMPHLVALKTQLFRAFKRVVSVLATQDAVEALALIWAISAKMTKEFTIPTFNGWVLLGIITRYLSFQLLKFVFFLRLAT